MAVQLSPKTQQDKVYLPMQVFEHNANYSESMKLLAENGLRPLTYQEALSRSSELIAKLKGKFFYLDSQGISKDGIHTFNDKGELAEVAGRESADQKVYVWSGNHPLSLRVCSDDVLKNFSRRFLLVGDAPPDVVVSVVVGISDVEAVIAEGSAALRRLQRNAKEL